MKRSKEIAPWADRSDKSDGMSLVMKYVVVSLVTKICRFWVGFLMKKREIGLVNGQLFRWPGSPNVFCTHNARQSKKCYSRKK